MATNWPITAAQVKTAIQDATIPDNDAELALFATAACERIDDLTGRTAEPTRHERADGTLPSLFVLAARETAKLWWQQTKNGSRNRPSQGEDPGGAPAGADLPRKVQGWLAAYPDRLYRADD